MLVKSIILIISMNSKFFNWRLLIFFAVCGYSEIECCEYSPSYDNTIAVTCNNINTEDDLNDMTNYLNNISQLFPSKPLAVSIDTCVGSLFPDDYFGTYRMAGLEMDKCGFTEVPYGLFESVCYQMTAFLRFRYNSITIIPSSQFLGCTALTELDLSNNNIVNISFDSFSSMGSLQSLYLMSNPIPRIDGFFGLNSLTQLYCDGDAIKYVSVNVFQGLNHLKQLSLPNNQIETLEDGVFGSNTFNILNLNDNPFNCNCSLLWLQDWLKKNDPLNEAHCHTPVTGPIVSTPFCVTTTPNIITGSPTSTLQTDSTSSLPSATTTFLTSTTTTTASTTSSSVATSTLTVPTAEPSTTEEPYVYTTSEILTSDLTTEISTPDLTTKGSTEPTTSATSTTAPTTTENSNDVTTTVDSTTLTTTEPTVSETSSSVSSTTTTATTSTTTTATTTITDTSTVSSTTNTPTAPSTADDTTTTSTSDTSSTPPTTGTSTTTERSTASTVSTTTIPTTFSSASTPADNNWDTIVNLTDVTNDLTVRWQPFESKVVIVYCPVSKECSSELVSETLDDLAPGLRTVVVANASEYNITGVDDYSRPYLVCIHYANFSSNHSNFNCGQNCMTTALPPSPLRTSDPPIEAGLPLSIAIGVICAVIVVCLFIIAALYYFLRWGVKKNDYEDLQLPSGDERPSRPLPVRPNAGRPSNISSLPNPLYNTTGGAPVDNRSYLYIESSVIGESDDAIRSEIYDEIVNVDEPLSPGNANSVNSNNQRL